VSTHDLPTIAGWWSGADIDEKEGLGLVDGDAANIERAARAADKAALVEALTESDVATVALDLAAPHHAAITAALHRFAGATSSTLVLLQADDLAGATTAVNLPGTDRERPNWRRKLDVEVSALLTAAPVAATLREYALVRGNDVAAGDAGPPALEA
jgi:glycogen operon protein